MDSALGAQITARANSQFSAMVQVVAEQQYNDTYAPYLEWANLKYEPTPDASLRIGRTVVATFLFSVSRNVGYSTPWVRQPTEVYRLVPVVNNDGVDATYKAHTGDFAHLLSATYGSTHPNLPDGNGKVDARHQWIIADTIERGASTLHIAYQQADVTAPVLNARFAELRLFGPQGIALDDKYDATNKRFSLVSVGEIYDPGDWFVAGEWGRVQYHSVLGAGTGWYVSGGYRVAKFTPYATYGVLKASSNTSDPGLTVSTLPPFLAGPAGAANAALNAALALIPIERTISVGTRWDFMKNADLKFQLDHTRNGAGSPGTLTDLQPGFQPGGTVNLISATFDFVL